MSAVVSNSELAMSSSAAKMPTSSFVTHILATAGRLDKEDLNAKLSQLSRKTSEMKIEVYDALHKSYAEFYPNFDALRLLSNRVSEFQKEMESQMNAIESQVKAQMQLSAAGNDNLFASWSETLSILSLLGRLVKIHEGFQLIGKDIGSKSFVRAAAQLVSIEHMLVDLNSMFGDSLKVLVHLRARHLTLKEQLINSLRTVWAESFQWKVAKDEAFAQNTEQTVELVLASSKEAKDRMANVIHAMSDLGILDASVKAFGEKLSKHLLQPLLTVAGVRVSLSTDPATTTLTITTPINRVTKPSPPDAVDALNKLEMALVYLNNCFLDYTISVVSPTEGTTETKKEAMNLIALLGKQLSEEFVESLISDCLARSVPSNHHELKGYSNVITTTECFQSKLIEIHFLDPQNTKLTDYVNNIDLVFANKKCQEILARARDLMKSPLHDVVSVSCVDCKLDEVELGLVGSEKLKVKSTEKMSELLDNKLSPPFRFPSCKISTCARELVEIAYQMLQEAVTSTKVSPPDGTDVTSASASKQCAVQLFYGVRNMLEMYCIVIPVYHKELLHTVPLVSAVHHNDCMYIAHHLTLLGHQYRPLLPEPLCHGAATFVDLIPVFRRLGAKSFMDQLVQQKAEILDCLSIAHGFVSIGEGDNFRNADRAVNQLTLKLRHLANVWKDVLPSGVYNKSTGTLLNCAIADVLEKICSLEDISEQDAKELNSILRTISDAGLELFASAQPASVYKFVPKWNKMEEMKFLLTARLQEIVDRWADGKGPLAGEFTAAELKQLVRALFQNTEKRAAVLALFK